MERFNKIILSGMMTILLLMTNSNGTVAISKDHPQKLVDEASM